MTKIYANGLQIEVEERGNPSDAPLLMIRGLGTQLIHWPERMLDQLVSSGFRVITFDNRDSGLSQKFPGAPETTPYTLTDMAWDTIGILKTLGADRAHVFGASMGGMIAQIATRLAPSLFMSAHIVMSATGGRHLPPPGSEMSRHLRDPAPAPDRASVVSHTLQSDRVWASPAFPFDETQRRALVARAYDRCYCPDGSARQLAAIESEPDQSMYLAEIRVPTLVIHGTADPLFPVSCGLEIAAGIPEAEFVSVTGMGHDLDGEPGVIVANTVKAFVDRKCRQLDNG